MAPYVTDEGGESIQTGDWELSVIPEDVGSYKRRRRRRSERPTITKRGKVSDSEDAESQTFGVIISTATEVEVGVPEKKQRPTIFVLHGSGPVQTETASKVRKSLLSTYTCPSEVVGIQDIELTGLKIATCIFLLDLETPFLAGMSEADFVALKTNGQKGSRHPLGHTRLR